MKDAKKLFVVTMVLSLLLVGTVTAQDGALAEMTAPLSGTVGYKFMTDYMWRGINMTSALGDATGKGAHELTYGLALDLADVGVDDVGTVGVTVTEAYFNSYARTSASKAFTDIDVTLSRVCPWSGGEWVFGYSNYKWANTGLGSDARSQELSASYSFQDGEIMRALLGTDMGENVLNPTVSYILDYDEAENGGLVVLALSHPMEPAEMPGVTLTPAMTLVYDDRYYGPYLESLNLPDDSLGKHRKMGYLEYALRAGADLGDMLGVTDGQLDMLSGVAYLDGVELPDAKWYAHLGVAYKW